MPDDLTARKERWAQKMAARPASTRTGADRLPPGQHLVTNWPVLDLGIHPDVPPEQWRLRVHGEVEHPTTFTWEQFMDLPQETQVSDFHCVTTWSQYDMAFTGVPFHEIAARVRPKPAAAHVLFKSYDGYSTNNALAVCMDDDVLIAHEWGGAPLSIEHGGPARVIIPKRYAWKGAKFVREIVFLERDQPGFWELRGYSNTAEPWTDDRFSRPT